jgi:isoquinoline 1-oxidoreductase subunit beta
VNPESVRSQTEGALIYGLRAALKNEIAVRNGAVEQTNFDSYDPIRITEAPPIEVYLVPSLEDPGGMGQPGLPPIAPPDGSDESRVFSCRTVFPVYARQGH